MSPTDKTSRWQTFKERLRDSARLPLMTLAIFVSCMVGWLGMWTAWRAAEWIFNRYLTRSWLP